MKTEILSFRIDKPKHRAHRALFDDDLPFKGKSFKVKKGVYNRKQKHRNKYDE